ncbi:hypothetical protein [uncultured Devosia sp.]|uniref:hypothetical protein n=1 Tax=uncultured Devosia sp. TaxID=211434 RepID=UPI0035CC8D47
MSKTTKRLSCALAGLVLAMGLAAAPALAQKTGAPPTTAAPADIDFGDDTSEWHNDGECDDPRFEGAGLADEVVDVDLKKDATDCRTAFEAGTVTLKATTTSPADIAIASPIDAIDFGDDSSEWNKDGECDDPRFEGTGSADELVDADLKKDATDCRAAYEAGTITLKDTTSSDTPVATAEIVYGDDTGEYNNDGECDDPRFEGAGVASEPSQDNRMHDATDCRAAVDAGTATFKVGETNDPAPFDFGTDNGRYANDGECDDLRFTGEGMDKKLLPEDISNDATDCRTLVESGSLTIIAVYEPAYAAGAPYDSKGINFGDNTSSYANDNQCDDPRFQGPGTATSLLDTDLRHDRDDCKAAFEAGTIILID